MYVDGEDVDLVLVLIGEVVVVLVEVEGKDSRVAMEFNTGSVSVESKSSTASKLLGLDARQTASRRTAAATRATFMKEWIRITPSLTCHTQPPGVRVRLEST